MICLSGANTLVMLLTGSITLSWQHSVEKIRWEEQYQAHPPYLYLTGASVLGSGAGMEPPSDAQLHNGRWYWQPDLKVKEVVLAGSEFTGEYTLCFAAGRCHPLSHWLDTGQQVILSACRPEGD
ncbi:DUF1850 domain-containing protein [Oceanimonas baumannii]|uniref:Uncharacterized protein DUF1850 n=1 Tax=Oceanimonas baumannii TaxID=129578 RepID=A0A235CN83_9GAMM|nr:DUF1850 domain-containing protein [Oceanimonas baumannii]OYD25844.1 hypothetical protein B6S09_03115 [Oceanimonas baumannii]TDW60141.1 uncharacterized protein DUF1850 [Oceanimonas baumannii]